MEPYKNSCDHCGVLVDRKYWTFDLEQCVVCDDTECKARQKKILKDAMDNIVDRMFKRLTFNKK